MDRLQVSHQSGQSAASATDPKVVYSTDRGQIYCGFAEHVLASKPLAKHKGDVQLIFTSPPFPLNRKKKYGNEQGDAYVKWLASFAPIFREYLKPDGSVVLELGNAWKPGEPVMSPLALEALLAFLKAGDFQLCQQFVVYNPARLPSPAQWVNIERIRVKDAFTHVWWMSPSSRPKANNRRILTPYSDSMKRLLATKKYNAGRRPSEHHIGETSFFHNNKGAIPSNVITLSNTNPNDRYLKYCRDHDISPHPARMPMGLPEFFIKFLTNPRNLVMDPFAGSNTTGACAESLKRRWISIEADARYASESICRFETGTIGETNESG